MKKYFLFFCFLSFSYADSLSGFFGYEEKIVEVDNEENITNVDNQEKLLSKALGNPRTLTADEFKEALSYAKSKAVMQQGEEDIKQWTILNNFTIKNAESFQQKQRIVLLKNPEIDISGEFSKSGFANRAKNKESLLNQKKIVENLSDRMALFAFFGNEPASIKSSQERVLYFFKMDFPKNVVIQVDTTKNDELYKTLKENITPSVWLAYKDSQENAHWYRVTGGLSTKQELLDNIEFIYTNIIREEFENDS